MRCPWALRVVGYGNNERLITCARTDSAQHLVHLDSAHSNLTWRSDAPGAMRLEPGGPVTRPAPRPEAPNVVRHGKCANVVCPNMANEGQMVTFVMSQGAAVSPDGRLRQVALILCAGCGDALARECRGG